MSSIASSLPANLPSSQTAASTSSLSPSGSATQGVLSSMGIGSGLNVSKLISTLVQADTAAQQNQINAEIATAKTSISAISTLQAALSGIQSSLSGLSDGSVFKTYQVTAAGAAGAAASFSASAGSTAAVGQYSIVVTQLAQAQVLTSSAFASSATVIGTGSLVVGVAGKSTALTIDSSNSSLQGIVDAINQAPGNPGVTASIVNASDGAHLILSAKQSGAANTITVTSSGGNGGLTAINYDPAGGGPNNLSVQTAAQDASLSVDGLAVSSASNVVTAALPGVSLNLQSADPGVTQTLGIGLDTGAVTQALQGLVTAYNGYNSSVAQLASYDPGSGKAGPLLGDASLLGLGSQLTTALGSVVGASGASLQSLADIGINFNTDGSLSLDTSKLSIALQSNPSGVAALFNSNNGYGAQVSKVLNAFNGPTGTLDGRVQSLNAQIQHYSQEQANLNQLITTETEAYRIQFTAMDSIVSQLKSTSTQLTQMMAGLNPTSIMNSSNKGG